MLNEGFLLLGFKVSLFKVNFDLSSLEDRMRLVAQILLSNTQRGLQ